MFPFHSILYADIIGLWAFASESIVDTMFAIHMFKERHIVFVVFSWKALDGNPYVFLYCHNLFSNHLSTCFSSSSALLT